MASETEDMVAYRPSAETREFLARRPVEPRTTIHAVQRRPFGLEPDVLLAGLSTGTFLLAVILFATGTWIGGLVVLVIALCSIALLAGAVRREPSSRVARTVRRAVTATSGFVRFGVLAGRTWGSASISLADLTRRRYRLRRQLHSQLAPLGEAVYRDDHARAARLKARAAHLEQALREANREAAGIKDDARENVRTEQATVQATQTLPTLTRATADEARQAPR